MHIVRVCIRALCVCVQAKVRFTGFEASWDTSMPHGSAEMFPARPLHAHSLAALLSSLISRSAIEVDAPEPEAGDGMEESDADDDTTGNLWACGDAPPMPPAGYTYALCPPLETEAQQRELIGRQVLVAHNAEPAGWHVGKVRFFGVGAKWKKVCKTANFMVHYTNETTDGSLKGEEGRELSGRNYGANEWWLLLDSATAS